MPKAITEKCAEATSMKWFVEVGNDKHRMARFFKILAKELIDASENRVSDIMTVEFSLLLVGYLTLKTNALIV